MSGPSFATPLPQAWRPWRKSGFGLLEIILVFVLVIGAAALVFSVYQGATTRHQTTATLEQVNTVAANIQGSVFAYPSSPQTWTNDMAVQAHILPAGMQTNAFGGAIEVNPNPGSNPREFIVVVRNIQTSACPDFLTSVSANPTWTWARMMSPPQPAGSGNLSGGTMLDTYIVAANKSNYNLIIARCGMVAGDTADIEFAFNYTTLH